MARVRSVDGSFETSLTGGWQCAAVEPGSIDHPRTLAASGVKWFDARAPGTAASALARASAWSLEDSRDFDAQDWWFRVRAKTASHSRTAKTILRFGGLATLADVWLDGEHILSSDNMFLAHEVDVGARLEVGAEIAIRFASLTEALKKRRPRPRWRARIVAQQQLRWLRTTLLGRIPSWTPPAAPVGPYRGVSIETRTKLAVTSAEVKTRVDGKDGVVDVALRVAVVDGRAIESARILVGEVEAELACEAGADGFLLRGSVRVSDIALWWPFSHGSPALHPVRALVRTSQGEVAVDLGRTGFRTVTLDRAGGRFGLRINGVEVFCRGACWTPLDVVGLASDKDAYRAALEMARAAGMNMLRVVGTMLYEAEEFHDLCDELGILVWQDFMFANMDYPAADDAFVRSVGAEAAQVLDRLGPSPSLAVLCGNSEVSQQAAMLGLPREEWSHPLFDQLLRDAALASRPDVPYLPTTPNGGTLPFHVSEGVSHYYGVGAYMRPLEDARRARVQFAAECLGFSNVPCEETLEQLLRDGEAPTSHPRWKARVPRDRGTSWDFDDVRDHYLRLLFGADPALLRTTDLPRYLELSRVTTGEAMAAAIAEWRRGGSSCRGALVWLYRDLWPGAGWGIVDALGRPKAAYYFLKRALAPVALLATDEGLNGLSLHAVNDGPRAIDAEVRLALYRLGDVRVGDGLATISIPAHGAIEISADAILGRFMDTTHAYRFGPPGHDLIVASLIDQKSGQRIGQAFAFPCGLSMPRSDDLGTQAFAEQTAPGEWRVTVRTKKFAQAVALDARGFVADDDFFHVEPGGEHVVTLRGPGASLSARVTPLNATSSIKVAVRSKP